MYLIYVKNDKVSVYLYASTYKLQLHTLEKSIVSQKEKLIYYTSQTQISFFIFSRDPQ